MSLSIVIKTIVYVFVLFNKRIARPVGILMVVVDGEAGKSVSQGRRAAEKVLIMYPNHFVYKTCFLYLHKPLKLCCT